MIFTYCLFKSSESNLHARQKELATFKTPSIILLFQIIFRYNILDGYIDKRYNIIRSKKFFL